MATPDYPRNYHRAMSDACIVHFHLLPALLSLLLLFFLPSPFSFLSLHFTSSLPLPLLLLHLQAWSSSSSFFYRPSRCHLYFLSFSTFGIFTSSSPPSFLSSKRGSENPRVYSILDQLIATRSILDGREDKTTSIASRILLSGDCWINAIHRERPLNVNPFDLTGSTYDITPRRRD